MFIRCNLATVLCGTGGDSVYSGLPTYVTFSFEVSFKSFRETQTQNKHRRKMAASASLSRNFTGLIRRAGMRSQLSAAIRLRGGAGLPVGSAPAPTAPLDENEELLWDDGSPNPEPCLDEVAPMVGKYEALGMLSAGMGFFVLLGYLAAWNDKASRIPWAPREYPYDNLRVELGGKPD